jgi:geranylgeranyl diphosphate synthase, type I
VTDPDLIVGWQFGLEDRLARFAADDLVDLFAPVSDSRIREAAAAYLTRPSRRLLGLGFLVQYHALSPAAPVPSADLTDIAAALEIRHAAILLHDDIVDGDTHRGGQPTAWHALAGIFGANAQGAAIFAGDVLAAAFLLPLLDTSLPATMRAELARTTLILTAKTGAGQCQQLYTDTALPIAQADENRVLAAHAANFSPYLHCSTWLAVTLADLPAEIARCIMHAAIPMATAFQIQNDIAGFTELERILASGNPRSLTLANTSDLARRRRTTLMTAALATLNGGKRQALARYLAGEADIPLREIAALIREARAVEHCITLTTNLLATSHARLRDDPGLPPRIKHAVADTWQFMTGLYDPASPLSRLYLKARPDLIPPAA